MKLQLMFVSMILAGSVSCALAAAEVDLFSATPVAPGARAAGMGGAYEAVSDDWTASFWKSGRASCREGV